MGSVPDRYRQVGLEEVIFAFGNESGPDPYSTLRYICALFVHFPLLFVVVGVIRRPASC